MSLLPEQYSSYAPNIDGLIILINNFVVVWFILTVIVMVYIVFTSLKKEGGKAKYITGIGWNETKWILIPLVLVVASDFTIDIATTKVWSLVEYEQQQPEADYEVKVIGQQFSWYFVYPGPDGKLDTPDDVADYEMLVLPVDKVVHLHLTAKDVLHSFYVKEFRFKQDVIPGRVIRRWVKATKTTANETREDDYYNGAIELICAEICGPGHGIMRSWVKIVSDEDYKAYIKQLYADNVAANSIGNGNVAMAEMRRN